MVSRGGFKNNRVVFHSVLPNRRAHTYSVLNQAMEYYESQNVKLHPRRHREYHKLARTVSSSDF